MTARRLQLGSGGQRRTAREPEAVARPDQLLGPAAAGAEPAGRRGAAAAGIQRRGQPAAGSPRAVRLPRSRATRTTCCWAPPTRARPMDKLMQSARRAAAGTRSRRACPSASRTRSVPGRRSATIRRPWQHFHAWLAERRIAPATLGVGRLTTCCRSRRRSSCAARLPQNGPAARRVFYYTSRFRQQAATERIGWHTEAFHRHFPPGPRDVDAGRRPPVLLRHRAGHGHDAQPDLGRLPAGLRLVRPGPAAGRGPGRHRGLDGAAVHVRPEHHLGRLPADGLPGGDLPQRQPRRRCRSSPGSRPATRPTCG